MENTYTSLPQVTLLQAAQTLPGLAAEQSVGLKGTRGITAGPLLIPLARPMIARMAEARTAGNSAEFEKARSNFLATMSTATAIDVLSAHDAGTRLPNELQHVAATRIKGHVLGLLGLAFLTAALRPKQDGRGRNNEVANARPNVQAVQPRQRIPVSLPAVDRLPERVVARGPITDQVIQRVAGRPLL